MQQLVALEYIMLFTHAVKRQNCTCEKRKDWKMDNIHQLHPKRITYCCIWYWSPCWFTISSLLVSWAT